MSSDGDAILAMPRRIGNSMKRPGTILTQIVKEIEDHYGIKIAEFRVTIDPSHRGNGWPSVNCVIVREQRARNAGQSR